MTRLTKLSLWIIFPLCAFARPDGYGDLDALCRDFVEVLKSSDNAELLEFCKKISPDEETASFMRKIKFSYRGFPDKYAGGSIVVDTNYKILYEFREKLKNRGLLDQLTFDKRPNREGMLMETFNVMASETQIILKSGDESIEGKLGEMLKVDGSWKVFTKPYFH